MSSCAETANRLPYHVSEYSKQLARVERFLCRIENQNRDSTEYDDDLWSFFQHCWHLKDWIKNDPSISPTQWSAMEGTIEGSLNLRICADLANRSKHLRLTNKREDADITRRSVTVKVGNPSSSTCEHIISLDDGTEKVALVVAKAAVNEWNLVFATFGLS